MSDFLLKSIEEHSVLWVVVSAAVGGLLGALVKFLFDTVATSRYQQQRTARTSMRRYQYPLLRAADTLDRRVQNFVQFVHRGWYEDPIDDYYRTSTLYVFGCYLGWCKVLEDDAFLEFITSDRRARKFSLQFYAVFKALTSFSYFEDVRPEEMDGVEKATVPRFTLTAIGELMIRHPESQAEFPRMLGFVESAERLGSDATFTKWFSDLEKSLLLGQKCSRESARWNRLLVFATMLRAFVSFLAPKSRQTAARYIPYLDQLHPTVAAKVRKELKVGKMDHLVVDGGLREGAPDRDAS